MRKVLFLFLAALLATTSLQAQPAVPEFAPLPYAFDALEPYIDAQTMEIHYSRHHRAYYDNMHKAASGSAFLERGLQEPSPKLPAGRKHFAIMPAGTSIMIFSGG